MPIYEYTCEKCEITKEITHGMSEKKSPKCPTCGKVMKRIISLNSFQLKGAGWYKTDYPKSGSSGAAKKESDGDAPAKGDASGKADAVEAKGDKKSETKGETKKEKKTSKVSDS